MARTVHFIAALIFSLSTASVAVAQDETLADIRQQLTVLFVDMQRLKRELSTTGGAVTETGGGSVLERIDLIEQQVVRLTAKTEELENRINRIVQDGTNRIGDLEFRLVELEGGDVSQLGETTTLGGEPATGTSVAAIADGDDQPELAVSEQFDFNQAKTALDEERYDDAAEAFAAFTQSYSGGPLSGDAHFHRGEALMALGDTSNAARAFLESFSGSPDGARAPDSLFQLGVALGKLGQIDEACIALLEVGARFPDSNAVAGATSEYQTLNCR